MEDLECQSQGFGLFPVLRVKLLTFLDLTKVVLVRLIPTLLGRGGDTGIKKSSLESLAKV